MAATDDAKLILETLSGKSLTPADLRKVYDGWNNARPREFEDTHPGNSPGSVTNEEAAQFFLDTLHDHIQDELFRVGRDNERRENAANARAKGQALRDIL